MSTARPKILTLDVSTGAAAFSTEPTNYYSKDAAQRASALIGRDAYSILRTKALQGIQRQKQVLGGLAKSFNAAVGELQALPSEAPAGGRSRLESAVWAVGQETHWSAIQWLGTSIETLGGLIQAFEASRDRTAGNDIAALLLLQDLDVLKVLQQKKRRKLAYWESLAGRPTHEELVKAGLSEAEAKRFLSDNRSSCASMLKRFQEIAAFYTAPMHQVFLKYKHGYTLVDPRMSPLYLETGSHDLADVNAELRSSFAVMHQDRFTGRRVVHLVHSSTSEIQATMDTALLAFDLAQELALSWLLELEHPEHRTAAVSGVPRAILMKWLDQGLDEAYDVTAFLLDNYPEDPRVEPAKLAAGVRTESNS